MEREEEDNSVVKFDVGGTMYRVSRTTLERFPETMLCLSASERWTKTDSTTDNTIFIDRNGERFQYILDYMRDNEVNLPCSISKEALLNEFKFYGFCVDINSIKTHLIHPSDLLEHVRCWKKRRFDKGTELDTEANMLSKKLKIIELEKKYTAFCYELFHRHIQTGKVQWAFKKEDFEKYGGFYTHKDYEFHGFNTISNSPHPIYLKNELLQKCAQLFQISYISACARFNDEGHINVKIGMKDKTKN